MKKKILAIFVICLLFLISILLCVFFVMNHLYVFLSMVIFLYLISIVSFVGLKKYRAFMKSRIIDPRKHLKRNYSKIYLGLQNEEMPDDNTLDLRGYYRNFYVDTLLVQRYYSFLCAEGTIKVYAGKNKHYVNDKRISPLDYPLLHPVTLLENGIKPQKYIMFNPLMGLLFIWASIFGKKRDGQYSFENQMSNIIEFCEVRNVRIEII